MLAEEARQGGRREGQRTKKKVLITFYGFFFPEFLAVGMTRDTCAISSADRPHRRPSPAPPPPPPPVEVAASPSADAAGRRAGRRMKMTVLCGFRGLMYKKTMTHHILQRRFCAGCVVEYKKIR